MPDSTAGVAEGAPEGLGDAVEEADAANESDPLAKSLCVMRFNPTLDAKPSPPADGCSCS